MSFCRGGWYYVSSLAFSPDGTMLATGDQWRVRLWDVMTGQQLVAPGVGADATCLVFSPDGLQLAANATEAGVGVNIWDLERGRGVWTLRGLTSPIAYTCFSADGSVVAANTLDWQVGIWDVKTAQLRHILEVPRGMFADNAAMAVSPDGTRFAFAAGNQVSLWNVESGEKISAWQLNEGLVDLLAFSGTNMLLSFREEMRSGGPGLFSGTRIEVDPRVYRIRDLLSTNPTEPIAEIADFPQYVFSAACSRDGSHVVVDGLGGPDGRQRILRVFDRAGQLVQDITTTRTYQDSWLILDPTGSRLAALTENSPVATLLEFPTGKYLGRLDPRPTCLAPRATEWVNVGTIFDGRSGLWILRQGGAKAVRLVGLDLDSYVTRATFASERSLLAWGNANGTVSVCAIQTVNARLTQIGTGW